MDKEERERLKKEEAEEKKKKEEEAAERAKEAAQAMTEEERQETGEANSALTHISIRDQQLFPPGRGQQRGEIDFRLRAGGISPRTSLGFRIKGGRHKP
jgi:hypothetical protein